MGQYFELFAYERRETLGELGKAGGCIRSSFPTAVIHRLAVPVAESEGGSDSDAGRGPAPSHQSPQDHSHLLQLPVDVTLLITDQLDLNSLYTFSDPPQPPTPHG